MAGRMMLCATVLMVLWLGNSEAERTPLSRGNAKPWIENECGKKVVRTSEPEGALYPRRWSVALDKGYMKGLCRWRVRAEEGQVIHVTVKYIRTDCQRNAHLMIKDGKSDVIIPNSCRGGEQTFVTTTNSMFVRFRARTSHKKYGGFYLEYSFSGANTTEPEMPTACSPGSLSLTDGTGSAQSEGFQDDGLGSYAANTNCAWMIDVGGDNNVLLTFDDFSVENSSECSKDFVDVYDGPDMEADLIARYCGDESIPEIKSNGSSLFIHFKSDDATTSNGFNFSWSTVIPATVPENPCDGTFQEISDGKGVITTPGFYSGGVGSDKDCRWLIKANASASHALRWDSFLGACDDRYQLLNMWKVSPVDVVDDSLMAGSPTYNDSLCEVISAKSKGGGDWLLIRLRTDSSGEAVGFSLSFETMDPHEPVDPTIPGCDGNSQGNTVTQLSPGSFSFASPGYDGTTQYGSGAYCSWNITATPGKGIRLNFSNVDMEDKVGPQCVSDGIVITGYAADGAFTQYEVKCGSEDFSIEVLYVRAFVAFVSDETGSGTGFQATWEEIDIPSES